MALAELVRATWGLFAACDRCSWGDEEAEYQRATDSALAAAHTMASAIMATAPTAPLPPPTQPSVLRRKQPPPSAHQQHAGGGDD
jgi:hypothetical protein